MLQLDNQTPFLAHICVLPDRFGVDTLYIVVKGTVTLRPLLALAEVQVPITIADEYRGEPGSSSLRYASEIHVGKPGTDVLLAGSAHVTNGREAVRLQVAMTVADRRKVVQVTGNRVWRDGRPSSPEPFQSMPLVWERAFGGSYQSDGRSGVHDRNPVGCGIPAGRSPADMEGLPLPNLEDPASLIEQAGASPTPVSFGPIAPSWLPRRAYAGTYDERWARMRAPFLPDDFDPRFFQSAVPEFAFDRYLQPGEAIQVIGAMPNGPLSFTVPDPRLQIVVTFAGAAHRPLVHLETLFVEPDQNRALFTWRAAFPCNRQTLKIQKIVIDRSNGRH